MTWAPNRVYGRGIAPGRFGAGGNGGTVQRGRREGTPRRAPMATPTTVVNSQKKFVVIGNDSDVVAAMRRLFYAAQQTAAKTISKAWIKIVEPKKQSNHPYTKKDAGKPDWWPTGTYYQPSGQPFKVQHTEPDHIDRFQRVELLVHLIGLVVEPNERQHRSIQHLGLNVAVFEEAIRNEMTAFYAKSQKNAEKKVYIDEIMKLAVKQQSYKANQLDATTRVYYALSPESMPACVDEEEDSEQDTKVPPTPPSSTASPLDTTGALYNSNSESVPSSATTPFPIPYPPTVLSSDLSAEHAAYIGATAAGGGGQLRASGNPGLDYYGGHYAANRRSSSIVAQHGSSFNSPVTPVPMPGHVYEGWSHQAGPTNSGMYTFPHQPAEGQAPFAEDHDVEMRYEYDGLPGPYHQ
ncbi:hypothetical protein GGR56DRAFT_308340 [Xylariaceae sp. FL0804]|nr:hypothetical protein GGR56DRAFT_308340 [Xylariaceae sp. FL0804]